MAIILRKSVLFLLLLVYVSAVQQKLVENNLLSRGGDTLMGNISSMIEDGSLVSQFENADPKAIAQVIKILKGLITDANNEIARLVKNIKDALIAKNNAKKIHDATLIKLGEAEKAEKIARDKLLIATDHHKMQILIHAQKAPGLKQEAATLQKAIGLLQPLGAINIRGWNGCKAVVDCGVLGKKICKAGKGTTLEHTALNLVKGKRYTLTLNFFALDSWDGEVGRVRVNGKLCWQKTINTHKTGKKNYCGANKGWFDQRFTVTCGFNSNSAGKAKIQVNGYLSGTIENESFGVNNAVLTS